jgi:hypothetical protein
METMALITSDVFLSERCPAVYKTRLLAAVNSLLGLIWLATGREPEMKSVAARGNAKESERAALVIWQSTQSSPGESAATNAGRRRVQSRAQHGRFGRRRVQVSGGGRFTKNGGVVYGKYKVDGVTLEEASRQNLAKDDSSGHAMEVNGGTATVNGGTAATTNNTF